MTINSDLLRNGLEEATKRLERARQERENAERKEKDIQDECTAYRVLLARKGETDPSDSSDSSSSDSNGNTGSKRSYIRQALLDAGPAGRTPAEIFKLVKAHGVSRPYVHSTLFRWKENGKVTERSGKYSFKDVE